MPTGNTDLPDELRARVEAAAHAENRTEDELVSEAVERYIDERKYQVIIERAAQRNKRAGRTEADVDRVVEEVRVENRRRTR